MVQLCMSRKVEFKFPTTFKLCSEGLLNSKIVWDRGKYLDMLKIFLNSFSSWDMLGYFHCLKLVVDFLLNLVTAALKLY